ncbi:MAG TPA: DUF5686 family protein [Bacteroidales bacterium]|nr:DUF5686 family protein [Bacteroidales bacterium]
MNRAAILSLLIILNSGISFSQVLKGRITTESGDPIPYSTVFIQELKQGTTANTKGDYEIKLPQGKYFVTYQSLGYTPVFYDLRVQEGTITKNVVLPVQYYEIPEVRISATGEDPAYNIMRKAIGMAPYHLNQINSYKAEVYIKGNLVINRIPRIIKRSIKMDSDGDAITEAASIKEGEVYLLESFNEIEFTAPATYRQRVISVNSTFPDQGDNISPMDIIQASFYQPVIADLAISPLSSQAFSYYRFKYLGATLQGNNTVSKIQVIPRMKSQQLFEGIIYIIEDLWCLHSLDLTNENMAGKLNIEQIYIPVQEEIWMPVSLKFEMNIGILGFSADAGYGTSVKYSEVTLNTALRKPGTDALSQVPVSVPSAAATESPVSKNQQKIEKILEKDELTNRDMIVMSRLMNRESEKALPDSVRNSREITDNTTHIIEKDANKKDSAYWAAIRPIPLSEQEIRSIRIRDSIKNDLAGRDVIEVRQDTSALSPKKKGKSKFAGSLKKLTTGHTWSDTTGLRFTFGGIADPENLRFNTVDGFAYGFDFRLSKQIKRSGSWWIAPEIDYAFSRERIMWRINSGYSFGKTNPASLFLRTGVMSSDIASGGSINTFLNSMTSLLLKKNYLKLYESQYITGGFRKNFSNSLRLELSAGYENRKVLENTTGFSFFRKSEEYTVNLPDNPYLDGDADPLNALRDQDHYEFTAGITFTPDQKYRMNNGRRIPAGSEWPEFRFSWKHGINEYKMPSERYRHFDMIRLEASKKYEPGAFSEFRWRVRTGGFLNNTYIPFFDFFHFNVQSFPVLLNDYEDAFFLPAYYSLSTPRLFGEAHIKYTTPYLLLKYLPGLSNTLMRENLSISWVGTRKNSSWFEAGYSISELFLVGEAGIFAGFDNLTFRCAGFRFIFKLN